MEIAEYTVGSSRLSWFFLTDVHVGNANFDEPAFKKAVRYINNVKDREVVVQLGGDHIEAININDKRFNPTAIDSKYEIRDLKDLPRLQTKHFYSLVKPIERYIKYAHIGNHEVSNVKYNYFDVYDYLVNDLLPDCKKLGYLSLMKINMQPNENSNKYFRLVTTHGRGGAGWKPGYSQSHTVDTFLGFDLDFGLIGHIHKLNVHSHEKAYIKPRKLELGWRREWYGTGGTFLRSLVPGNSNYHEGSKGYHADIGFLEIRIDKTNGFFKYSIVEHRL